MCVFFLKENDDEIIKIIIGLICSVLFDKIRLPSIVESHVIEEVRFDEQMVDGDDDDQRQRQRIE